LKDFKAALAMLSTALELVESDSQIMNRNFYYQLIHQNLGFTYFQLKQYSKAAFHWEQVCKILQIQSKELQDTLILEALLYTLGKIYQAKNQLPLAIDKFMQSLKIS